MRSAKRLFDDANLALTPHRWRPQNLESASHSKKCFWQRRQARMFAVPACRTNSSSSTNIREIKVLFRHDYLHYSNSEQAHKANKARPHKNQSSQLKQHIQRYRFPRPTPAHRTKWSHRNPSKDSAWRANAEVSRAKDPTANHLLMIFLLLLKCYLLSQRASSLPATPRP